ncbi:hypothetical protein NHJ6243_008541 [Beauveria neobassiana]
MTWQRRGKALAEQRPQSTLCECVILARPQLPNL